MSPDLNGTAATVKPGAIKQQAVVTDGFISVQSVLGLMHRGVGWSDSRLIVLIGRCLRIIAPLLLQCYLCVTRFCALAVQIVFVSFNCLSFPTAPHFVYATVKLRLVHQQAAPIRNLVHRPWVSAAVVVRLACSLAMPTQMTRTSTWICPLGLPGVHIPPIRFLSAQHVSGVVQVKVRFN